ncbi:hypothetical protein [Solilutibacter tolerans]|uniref:Uncharacterized protein n=1 Tax=Solilutibacter tolerans TaxID=1604334 RepID=A0A1N6XNK8_9GAMM|nr:hypothetical protein [Lysobacter tolerans]SIR03880.1 hypothetical protein SAMN05421546_2293 [Lysobacter tolerans]
MNTVPSQQPILRFPGHEHPDLPLQPGMNGLCRDPDLERGLMLTPGGGSSLIEFCSDARGLWLHVAEGVRGVHVNGRPVQSLSHLHVGDTIHFEGVEMQLADPQPRVAQPANEGEPRPARLLLRGHGGSVHGLSVALEKPLRMGGDGGLRIEGVTHSIGELVPMGENAVHLRLHKDAGDCRLNGWPAVDTWLESGDQLLLAPGCRYLVESPGYEPVQAPIERPLGEALGLPTNGEGRGLRMPWLLIAAIASALILAALLWFGVK